MPKGVKGEIRERLEKSLPCTSPVFKGISSKKGRDVEISTQE
jgi:hypothetical protein